MKSATSISVAGWLLAWRRGDGGWLAYVQYRRGPDSIIAIGSTRATFGRPVSPTLANEFSPEMKLVNPHSDYEKVAGQPPQLSGQRPRVGLLSRVVGDQSLWLRGASRSMPWR